MSTLPCNCVSTTVNRDRIDGSVMHFGRFHQVSAEAHYMDIAIFCSEDNRIELYATCSDFIAAKGSGQALLSE